jgi:serine/threonine-protein kinase RsbW
MGRSASVGCDYEVTEGEARMPHGVASSGTTGSRRRHCLADAPEIGEIVTAPEYAKQKGHHDTWCVLAELSVPSEPGNERIAMERVAEVVKELGLSEQRLERLKTAVAEATMNAIEHGNRRLPEVPVAIEVLSSGADLSVRINDQGRSLVPDPDTEVPDLEAKLVGLQTPRGWGLFLIRNMVDEMHITSDEVHHTVGLIMHLEGGEDAG